MGGALTASIPNGTTTRHFYAADRNYKKQLSFLEHPVKISFPDSAYIPAEQVGSCGAEMNCAIETNRSQGRPT
jgi:hypothetical protein